MFALLPRTGVEDIADDIEGMKSVARGTWEDADKNKKAQDQLIHYSEAKVCLIKGEKVRRIIARFRFRRKGTTLEDFSILDTHSNSNLRYFDREE